MVKERDARYYSYDKSGRLISVEYAAKPEKNEYYAYDKQGNIAEKRMGDKIYKYTYDTANQLMEMESPEGKREYFYDRAGRLVSEKLNGEIDVEYEYGYLDKVIEVDRNGRQQNLRTMALVCWRKRLFTTAARKCGYGPAWH